MIIYVDIDETICFYKGERHYPDAQPDLANIKKINTLYDEGNEIIYWTARGSNSGSCSLRGISFPTDTGRHYRCLV